jgi:hypothetical protein
VCPRRGSAEGDADGCGNFVDFAQVFGAGSNVNVDQLVASGAVDVAPG